MNFVKSREYFFLLLLLAICHRGYCQENKNAIDEQIEISDKADYNFYLKTKPDVVTLSSLSYSTSAETTQINHPQAFEYWNSEDQWDEIGPVTSSDNNTYDVGRLSTIAIDPLNDSIVLAGSPSGGLYYTLDKGNNWINAGLDRPMEEHGLNFFTPGISSIIIIHENNKTYWIIATGDKDHVFSSSKGAIRSTDFGNSWHLLNGTQPENIPSSDYYIRKLFQHPDSSKIIFAATSRGIYKTSNALVENPDDIKWGKILDDPNSNGEGYFDLEFHKTQPNVMFASKEYRTSNSIVGDEIIWTTDGGNSWEPLPNLNKILPIGVEFTFFLSLLELTKANDDILYVYIKGKEHSNYYNDFWKYKFTDSSWVQLDTLPYIQGNGRNGFAVSPLDENLIYCATVETYRSEDGGYNWISDNDLLEVNGKKKRFPHIDVQELKFNGAGTELWAASDGGPFLKVLNDTLWINKVNNMGLAKILQFDHSEIEPGNYLFGGWDVGSQLYHGDQKLWTQIGVGDGYGCAFDNEEEGTFYTATYSYDHNNIYSYKNWERDSVLTYGDFWQANIVVNPVNHNILYMSLGDKIVRSFNQGESWEVMVTPAELGLNPSYFLLWDMHIAKKNGNYLYLRVESSSSSEHARIFKSTNVNENQSSIKWIDITPDNMPNAWLSDLTVNDQDPDCIWISFSTFGATKIMEYKEKTWSDITSNLQFYNSGVHSMAYLNSNKEGLFAGTYYGIFYREDTLSNWILYKPGLPNVKPVDLKINYSIGKIAVGLDGRGIWETSLPEDYINPEENSNSASPLHLFPNPVVDLIHIEMLENNISGADFNIYTMEGKLIINFRLPPLEQYKEISLSGLSQGLYILQGKYDGEIICNEKLVIVR